MSEIDYISTVYRGVISKYDELKDIVAEYARGFDVDRVYKLDLAALLLAIYEMKYMPDIPLGTSIAEAVELVKIYSTEKSYSFVNGILSSVYKSLNQK
jgi:N utilization substance protein B